MDATLLRRCAAEGLGTALLVVFGPGSLVAALRLGDGELDPAGLSMVALAFGLVVALGCTPSARRPARTSTRR
jgi:glycerol uptake facilitator protein